MDALGCVCMCVCGGGGGLVRTSWYINMIFIIYYLTPVEVLSH